MKIGIEQFIKQNAGWDPKYGLGHKEEEWQENYDIACKVEERLQNNYPMDGDVHPGDLVEISDGYRVYKNALVCSIGKNGVCEVCERWSAFTFGKSFSVSGGVWHSIHKSNFVRNGNGVATYWTWGRNGAGADQGIYFPVLVQRWIVPYEKQQPETTVLFRTSKLRSEPRVSITGPGFSTLATFCSVKAFKAWAEYVGFGYEKLGQAWNGVISRRGKQNITDRLFWTMDDLPDGAKPLFAMSNGSMVQCYVSNDGDTITTWRPNPNSKAVFNPLPFEEAKRYYSNPMGV